MLQSISWPTYFTACAILLALYYCGILFLYYRQDIALLFRQQIPFRKQEAFASSNQTVLSQAGNDIDALGESLKDELTAFVASVGSQYNKTELQYGLQLLLKKYAVLKNAVIQPEITKKIISECKNNCSIELSDEEAGMLWNG